MQKFSPKSIRFYIEEFDKRLAELQSVAGIVAKTETSVKNSVDAFLKAAVKKKLEGGFLGHLDLDPETLYRLTEVNMTDVSKLVGVSETVLVNAYRIPSVDARKIVDYGLLRAARCHHKISLFVLPARNTVTSSVFSSVV